VPQLVEVEQKLELNSTTTQAIELRTALLDPKSQWEYKEVKGINNLIHYCKKIYVPKSLHR